MTGYFGAFLEGRFNDTARTQESIRVLRRRSPIPGLEQGSPKGPIRLCLRVWDDLEIYTKRMVAIRRESYTQSG